MSFAAEKVGIQMIFTPSLMALSAVKGQKPPTWPFRTMVPSATRPGKVSLRIRAWPIVGQ